MFSDIVAMSVVILPDTQFDALIFVQRRHGAA